MLSKLDYARLSLEAHLFFARIMKEHAFFIEAALASKYKNLRGKARVLCINLTDYWMRLWQYPQEL